RVESREICQLGACGNVFCSLATDILGGAMLDKTDVELIANLTVKAMQALEQKMRGELTAASRTAELIEESRALREELKAAQKRIVELETPVLDTQKRIAEIESFFR